MRPMNNKKYICNNDIEYEIIVDHLNNEILLGFSIILAIFL